MSDASFLPPFIPLRQLARWATGLLVATLVAAWVAVGVDLHELGLLSKASGGEPVAPVEREAWTLTYDALFWVRFALFAATAAAFLAWLWQARVNLRAMGARRLRYTREWAVASFLVPVLNAFRPYQVVREIWQGSLPQNLDPFAWRELPVPPLLALWWGTFLGWGALELMSLLAAIGGEFNLPKLQMASAVRLLADATAAVAAFLACFVVARISDAQDQKRRLQARGDGEAAGGALAATGPAGVGSQER